MTNLIANRERLGSVRRKLNISLQPFPDFDTFQSTNIPPEILRVFVLQDAALSVVIKDPNGPLQSADGARWSDVVISGINAQELQDFLDLVQAGVDKAEQWAINPEDAPVETDPDLFSALHWALKAAASAASISLPLSVSSGGTGATDAPTARTNLGLGSIATLDAGEIPNADDFALEPAQATDPDDETFGTVSGELLAAVRDQYQLGWDQTWQSVTGSRTNNTSYQNTTGKPIQVSAGTGTAGSSSTWQASPDNSSWVAVGFSSVTAGMSVHFIVPNGWYYRLNGSINIATWSELR